MALTGQSETPNVTRIGDGIVAALVLGIPTVTECHATADSIIASVDALSARDPASSITISIGGVCISAGRKVNCEDWLGQADVACRMAGKKSGNSFHLDVAGGAMGEPADALRLFNVTEAIKTNRLQCRFQPLAVMSERAGSTEAQYYQLRVQIVAPKGEVHTPRRWSTLANSCACWTDGLCVKRSQPFTRISPALGMERRISFQCCFPSRACMTRRCPGGYKASFNTLVLVL